MPDPNPIETARIVHCRRALSVVGRVLATVVLGVLGVVATVATGLGDVGPGSTRCASAAPAMAGSARVALVIDYGTVAGGSGRVDTFCVEVAGGATGFDVLKAAGIPFRLHTSGLVCGLSGYPAEPACGEHTPTGYRYWAYFHGDGEAWDYQSIGPAASRPATGSVEGWRFVEGTGNPNDPGPRHAAAYGTICSAPPTTPPTVAPTTPPPTVPPAASPTTAPPVSALPGAAPTVPGGSGGDASTPPVPGADDAASASAGTTPTGTASDPEHAEGADSDDDDGPLGEGDAAQAAATSELTVDDGGSSPVGAVLGGAAVLGLGALAVQRFRSSGSDGSS